METRIFFPVQDMTVYFVSISLIMAVLGYLWHFRQFPGGKEQIKNQIIKIFWILSIAMIGNSKTMEEKVFWLKIFLLSEIFSPYYWLMFISKISRQNVSFKFIFFVRAVALFLAGLVVSDTWFQSMEFSVWLENGDLYIQENWGEVIRSFYGYGLCLVTIFLILKWIYTTDGMRRKQALWFGASGFIVIPILAIKEVLKSNLWDPVPIGFLIMALFITWGFYRWHIYDVVSMAWKTSIQQMYEGVIVVDEYDYIVESNPAGEKLLQDLSVKRGDSYQKLLTAWPSLYDLKTKKIVEVEMTVANGVTCYEIQWANLLVKGHLLGKVLIFKDITERKMIEQKFIKQEKAISVLKERSRLGRELHDGPGQVWGYVTMQVEAADTWIGKGEIGKARYILSELLESVQAVHIDMRESITGLKIMQQGNFIDSLQKYIKWFEKTCEIAVSIEYDLSEDSLSSIEKVQLLRIIQELLTNIRKHANATVIKLRFYQREKTVFCEVEDDGNGNGFMAADKSGHFGLEIIQERIDEIGGVILTRPALQRGTIVIVEIHGSSKERVLP